MNTKNLFGMGIRLAYTLLLPTVLLISCKQNDPDVVIVDDDDAVEVNFEDVATDIRVVPLVSDEPIGGCRLIQCYGNELLFLDKDSKIVYYFENNILKGKLNAAGRGPGEYSDVNYFTYSPKDKMLYVVPSASDLIYWYSVPDMKYCGKTQSIGMISFIAMHNDKTFFISVCNQGLDSCYIQLLDKNTGCVVSDIQNINGYAYREAKESMVCYNISNHQYGLSGYENAIGVLSDDNEYKTMFKYGFGDKNVPEDILNNLKLSNLKTFLDFMNYLNEYGKKSLLGVACPRIDGNAVSFWYYYAVGDSNDDFFFYRQDNKKITNLKGFHVSGLNHSIVPGCLTDDGYATLFEGDKSTHADLSSEPSLLCKKIFDLMSKNNYNNPVILYFKIK